MSVCPVLFNLLTTLLETTLLVVAWSRGFKAVPQRKLPIMVMGFFATYPLSRFVTRPGNSRA